jgi:hypothetical protein
VQKSRKVIFLARIKRTADDPPARRFDFGD